jgi:phosphopentomutase
MNERIRQLAEQARYYVADAIELGFPQDQIDDIRDEKFAELIVRECAKIGDNYQEILGNEPECFNCRKVAYGIVDKIIQHFGVEE